MRAGTQNKIDACHAEIDRLIKMEHSYLDRTDPPRHSLDATIRQAKLDKYSYPPDIRENMGKIGTVSLP